MVSREIIAGEISTYQRVKNYVLCLFGQDKNEVPEAIRNIIKYEIKFKGGI